MLAHRYISIFTALLCYEVLSIGFPFLLYLYVSGIMIMSYTVEFSVSTTSSLRGFILTLAGSLRLFLLSLLCYLICDDVKVIISVTGEIKRAVTVSATKLC